MSDIDHSDRRTDRKAKELEKRAKVRLVRGIRHMMATPESREFVYGLLQKTHTFHTSFNPNANQMSFNEGERNIGLIFQAPLMTEVPDLYMQMLKEAKEREDARRTELADAALDGDQQSDGEGAGDQG